MNPVVSAEQRGPALWVTIHRPEAGNAVNNDVVAGLGAAVERVEHDTSIRALVLAGSGGVFCAGADIHQNGTLLAAGRTDEVAAFLGRAANLTDRIAGLPVPTIAAVDGAAFAGGFELVLACDIVVATPRARFADGHVVHGFVPGWGSTARAPRKLGPAVAARLLLVGDPLRPEQLPQLVTDIVAPEHLVERVTELIDRIAAAGPVAIERVKDLLARSADSTQADALAAERVVLRQHLESDELTEGASAFMERRRPRFGGRPPA